MAAPSWLHLKAQDPRQALPEPLRARDAMQGRDCAWVEQMTPFVHGFADQAKWIVDPFCGFGSTLLAALDGGVRCAGVELDAKRALLAKQRLAMSGAHDEHYPVLTGSLAHEAVQDALLDLECRGGRSFSLCLTNIPYFGCAHESASNGRSSPEQLYGKPFYEHYLQGLRDVFAGVHRVLAPDGWVIVMAQNLNLNGTFVPLAWDVARLLGERFAAHEERVLLYDKPGDPDPSFPSSTNRAHEYALVFKKQPARLDTDEGRQLVEQMSHARFEFLLYGSFARWLQGDPQASPNDIDIFCPPDDAEMSRLMRWLEDHGFRIESWNAAVKPPIVAAVLAYRYYFRAARISRQGKILQLDIAVAADRGTFDARIAAARAPGLTVTATAATAAANHGEAPGP